MCVFNLVVRLVILFVRTVVQHRSLLVRLQRVSLVL
jgi:heme exporter protein D